MSETVAIALIAGLPTATVAVVALVFNFLQERWRRAHEDVQLGRRFDHEREMRLFEWKRQDQLARLAPIGGFLDAISHAAFGLYLPAADGSGVGERLRRLLVLFDEQGHVVCRTSDVELHDHLSIILTWVRDNINTAGSWEEGRTKLDALEQAVQAAWDRLEELRSELLERPPGPQAPTPTAHPL